MPKSTKGASAPVSPIYSEEPQPINGFYPVTQLQLEADCYINMEAAEGIRALFGAIELLAENHEAIEIKGLAKHGKNIADLLHNDIAVIRERTENAGLVGYLVQEATSHD
jgi:hypothetical protein